MEGGIPHLGCSISRALWRLWSGTEGTGNYFLVLSLTVHASGSWLKQCFILQRLRRLLVLGSQTLTPSVYLDRHRRGDSCP